MLPAVACKADATVEFGSILQPTERGCDAPVWTGPKGVRRSS